MEKQDRQWMINQSYKDLVKEIRRDLKEDILDDIHQRICQMETVLQNGVTIWAHAEGESFDRIHAARQKTYKKIIFLRKMWQIIHLRY